MNEQSTYRVGRHQPQNVYRGEQYIGVMFSPEDAAAVVRCLNLAAGTGIPTTTSEQPVIYKGPVMGGPMQGENLVASRAIMPDYSGVHGHGSYIWVPEARWWIWAPRAEIGIPTTVPERTLVALIDREGDEWIRVGPDSHTLDPSDGHGWTRAKLDLDPDWGPVTEKWSDDGK